MDSVAVTVPLRPPTKKMKKRKELDALAAPHAITRRNSGKRSSQELLTDSSDDRSEYWSVSTRGGRKCRGSRRSRSCPGFLRACSAFLACASVLATATLIWLFIDVRQQLGALRTELDQVIAGNEGVPDFLQKYHSQSRDLQNNQTIIFTNITDIKAQIANFTTQLTIMQHELHEVQETIKSAPELVHVPSKLNDLSKEISTWGSRITDLMSTTNASTETSKRIQSVQNGILKNITTIEHLLAELSNVTQQPQTVVSNESKAQTELMSSKIAELVANLTSVNSTLSREVKWLGDDQKGDHAKLIKMQEVIEDVRTKAMSMYTEIEKLKVQGTLKETIDKLATDVNSVKETDEGLASKIKTLEDQYNSLLASLTELQNLKSNITAQNTGTNESNLNHDATEAPKVTDSKTETSKGLTEAAGGEVSLNSELATGAGST